MRRNPVLARILLVPYLIAVAWIVFAPADDASRVTGVVAWAADFVATLGIPRMPGYVVLEFLANIALFIPFGVLVRLATTRLLWWAVALLGFATSVTIELVQLSLPSRFSTVSDVVANTAGTAIGWVLVSILSRESRDLTTRTADLIDR
ncbi:VanZ family protein [Diaminobutyricimonas sp. LJ205]|uniref:VanZ family protein n=1 Tax=Diaminobutyricimonas sp. LJ205 TaxID=2683590 RepID=UPI0012F4C69D|nr:VanZ family protein [Diaminobutyricimonas sp. LJ205]